MNDKLSYPHIWLKPGSESPAIEGRRLTVRFMTIFLNDPEWSVDRICEEYDLTPAQVYAAWLYYYDHKEEIDKEIVEDNEAYEKMANDPARKAQIQALKDKKAKKTNE